MHCLDWFPTKDEGYLRYYPNIKNGNDNINYDNNNFVQHLAQL